MTSEATTEAMRNPYATGTAESEAWIRGANAALWAVSVAMDESDYAQNICRDAEVWLGLLGEQEDER